MYKLHIIIFNALTTSIAFASYEIGIKNGFFAPRDGRWNCVVSQKIKGQRANIDPIVYNGTKKDAYNRLIKVINAYGDTRIITQTSDYIHVEFTIGERCFIDDVEFYFPHDASIIHVRSASRVGIYDFGVNKKRIEKVRDMFNTQQ